MDGNDSLSEDNKIPLEILKIRQYSGLDILTNIIYECNNVFIVFTIVPIAPFTPKFTSKLKSA